MNAATDLGDPSRVPRDAVGFLMALAAGRDLFPIRRNPTLASTLCEELDNIEAGFDSDIYTVDEGVRSAILDTVRAVRSALKD